MADQDLFLEERNAQLPPPHLPGYQDPSMVLGGIIDEKKMAVLEEISMKQAEIDNESTSLSQLIM